MSNIVNVSLEEELQNSYLSYAMSVIISRAIPDVRDGLKPVHRRILFAMNEANCFTDKPHRKSARIIGDVMGKYHPHGDSAIYDALVRMAQDFSLRMPLIDGQGNFGSMDGDAAAAMRYTEVRLSRLAQAVIGNIYEDTIEFNDNYDNSSKEPSILAAEFPNILVNGSSGIAVGLATNIPTHNLTEVIDATLLYLDNKDITVAELMEVIPGPDFPTGGIIAGKSGIYSAFTRGKGKIALKGKTTVEKLAHDREQIVITEVPYQVNKAKLVAHIATLIREKKLEGISDLRDESDREGIRIVIELKKNIDSNTILKQILHYTTLKTSFAINMVALNQGKPELLSLKQILSEFLSFRRTVVTRRLQFQLNKAQQRSNILIALYIAVTQIDKIISFIRTAGDVNDIITKLSQYTWPILPELEESILLTSEKATPTYIFNEQQIKAILEIRLHRLTSLEKTKIYQELQEVNEKIRYCIKILDSAELLTALIREELQEIKNNFVSVRKTIITEEDEEDVDENLIIKEEMVVTVTIAGYVKRVKLDTYKAQKRGGKGRSGQDTRDEDVISNIFVADTHTNILFFSSIGKVYKLKLHKLPLGTPQSRGRALVNILPLSDKEYITSIMPFPQQGEDKLSIIFATEQGNIRRNELTDFQYVPSNGKIAIRLDTEDKLIDVKTAKTNEHIILATKLGKSLRFAITDLRIFKSRASSGVRGIKLSSNDIVVSMSLLAGIEIDLTTREQLLKISAHKRMTMNSDDDIGKLARQEQFILTVTEKGFGKRSSAYEYRLTKRSGSGICNITVSKRNGNVVDSFSVKQDDNIILITNEGQLIRIAVNDIRITAREAQGVILFRIKKNERIVSVAKVAECSSVA